MCKEIEFSFIIPHKNCPNLLKRCVDSIPVRDDVQIIVVDDNSDEGKKPIIDRKEVEVILLDSEHSKGAGRARNVGLKYAHGKWLLFADADDYYTEDINVILNKYANDEITDMVILNAQQVDEYGNISSLSINRYISNYLKHRFYSEKVIRYGLWTPWSRMVKKELVDKYSLKYEEVPTGNDMMFCLYCSKYSKTIDVEKTIVYNYLKPTGRSLTNSYSKEMSSIKPKVDRTFRRRTFYKGVNYAFHPSHIRSRYIAYKTNKKFLRLYNTCLREYSYSFFEDIINHIRIQIGRMLRIL